MPDRKEHERFTLGGGQERQCAQHVGRFDTAFLSALGAQSPFRHLLVIGTDEPFAADFAEIDVAQDRESPCPDAGPGDETVARGPCLGQCLLRQIVGAVTIAAQRTRIGAQMGNDRRQFDVKFRVGQPGQVFLAPSIS
jgi:hypothetical protein